MGLKFHVNGSLSVAVALTEWTLLRACCKKKTTTARNVLFATIKLVKQFTTSFGYYIKCNSVILQDCNVDQERIKGKGVTGRKLFLNMVTSTRFTRGCYYLGRGWNACKDVWAFHMSKLPARGRVISRPAVVLQTRELSTNNLDENESSRQANVELAVFRKTNSSLLSQLKMFQTGDNK